jgi:ATP-dependent Clp protease ATP-binding subunit ClpA
MFERFTEQARRSIFFARYEASQYGSPIIETEHILLGVLREDKRLVRSLFNRVGATESIRKEIEAQITRHDRVPTSVEVPLSKESKQILQYAADSAAKLKHRHIGTVHVILGVLRVEGCRAARILESQHIDTDKIRAAIEEQWTSAAPDRGYPRDVVTFSSRKAELQTVAETLVEIWAIRDISRFFDLFASSGQFWDSHGTCWSGVNVRQGIEAQFAAHKMEVEQVALEQV